MINSIKIRNYKIRDLKEVLNIYNFHIKNGLGNFQEEIISFADFHMLSQDILRFNLPFLVCHTKEKILGFTYLSNFRNKSGYKFSFENSIYIHNDYTGMGIGYKLLKELIKVSKNNPRIKTIIAVIGSHKSQTSIKIHEKNGFKMIGTLKKVGFKKNQWLNSIYMQKVFK